jgi:hypothetical protein
MAKRAAQTYQMYLRSKDFISIKRQCIQVLEKKKLSITTSLERKEAKLQQDLVKHRALQEQAVQLRKKYGVDALVPKGADIVVEQVSDLELDSESDMELETELDMSEEERADDIDIHEVAKELEVSRKRWSASFADLGVKLGAEKCEKPEEEPAENIDKKGWGTRMTAWEKSSRRSSTSTTSSTKERRAARLRLLEDDCCAWV